VALEERALDRIDELRAERLDRVDECHFCLSSDPAKLIYIDERCCRSRYSLLLPRSETSPCRRGGRGCARVQGARRPDARLDRQPARGGGCRGGLRRRADI